MTEAGTATIKVDLDTTEAEASAKRFGTVLRSSATDARQAALALAIESLDAFGTPPGSEAIVSRAEVFFGFLVGVTPADPIATAYRSTVLANLVAARDFIEADSPGLSDDAYVRLQPLVHDLDLRSFVIDNIDLNTLIAALEA